MVQAFKGTNLHSIAFSSIIECYAQKGFYFDGLNLYKNVILYGFLPKVSCLNALLDVLDNVSEFNLAYCLYGSMIRNGIMPNLSTLILISQIMCKDGKFDNVVKILDSGFGNSAIFDMVIDGYSRIGNFEAAIGLVNEMCKRNLEPGFCTYGSVLDGACKFSDDNVVEMMMSAMKERKLVPRNLSYVYDDVIRRFCDVGKSYAAEFLFGKARDGGVVLEDSTFGHMLGVLCKGGRVDRALGLYELISKEKIVIKKSNYQELAESLCKETPSENVNKSLIRLIMKGFSPSVSEISKFVMKLCRDENWKEVEALLNVMLQSDIWPDLACCRLLVKHYCSTGQIDSALVLHQTLDKSKILWDVTTYNILLRKLLTEAMVDEALKLFESMRRNDVVNRASFVVMISGLSQVKDMKKAMEVHDEMLKRGLKPSSKTYRSLISVFR